MVRVINYSGRQCFSLPDGASNKLFRMKILKTQQNVLSFFVAYAIIDLSKGEKTIMKVKTGYLYHIKDEFFDLVEDKNLMTNHERGRTRPTYFTVKDDDILWFIPLSSKVEKYKRIRDKKIKKYGECNTILIQKILGQDTAVLIQNSFPTLEKYIDHVHLTENGKPAKVIEYIKKEILLNFEKVLKLKKIGINLFLADVDTVEKKMKIEQEKDSELVYN